MELHELHVAELGPRAIGQGQSVAGGHGRVGGFAIDLAGPAGGQDRLLGPDERLAVLLVPDDRAAAGAGVREQVDREGLLPDLDVIEPGEAFGHGPHDLLAGGVAQGVDDAVVAVAALAAQGQAASDRVEVRAPADQFLDPLRGLADHPLHDLGIAERAAGLERVGYVVFETVFRIDHARNAALGVGAIGDLQAVLGDDQDREAADRRPGRRGSRPARRR